MEALSGEPVSVSRVVVEGAVRTKAYVVEDELREAREAKTFGEMVVAVDTAIRALNRLGLFATVDATVGKDEWGGGGGHVVGTKIVVHVKEKQIGALKLGATATTGGDADVCWEAAGTLRGALGHGETAKVTYSNSRLAATGREVELTLRKPRLAHRPVTAELELQDSLQAPPGWGIAASACHSMRSRGGSLVFEARPRGALVADTDTAAVKLEVRHRTSAGPATHDAAGSTTHDGGGSYYASTAESLKVSVKVEATHDDRDSRLHPTVGKSAHASLEVAGLGGLGDAAFARAQAHAQTHVPVALVESFGAVVLSLVARVGATLPLSVTLGGGLHNSRGLHANDRFYLGGPTTLRGFELCGVGERDTTEEPADYRRLRPFAAFHRLYRRLRGDDPADFLNEAPPPPLRATGGNATYSCGVFLTAPTPSRYLTDAGVRAQLFANVGALVDDWVLGNIVDTSRVSVGVGLTCAFANTARVEVNHAWVLRAQPSDAIANLQFGISADFG